MAKASSGATYIVRRPGAVSSFRRSIRDESGEVQNVLVFDPDQPVELTADELEFIKDDIGHALAVAEPDEKRPGNYNVDWPKTLELRESLGASNGEPQEPKRKRVKTTEAKKAEEPTEEKVSEADAIRQQLAETPNASNKDVIESLAAKGYEVSGSQVSRERK